jgi:hypothetical protein
MLVAALGLGAAAAVVREVLSDLDRSDPADPWAPHRKGC